MTILEKITAYKKREVSAKKEMIPTSILERGTWFHAPTQSLSNALVSSSHGIIAEHKRRSPSKPIINTSSDIVEVAQGYEKAGVAGMSVLTDTYFFGGSLDDICLAKKACALPLLRKEFIIDPYQILEAKTYGADAILLIAACLTEKELREFSSFASTLSLEVLVEIHNEKELQRSLHANVSMIGVNNRNLKTFETSIENSMLLSSAIPKEFVKISESGLTNPASIQELKTYGYEGFLIGEAFMKTEKPGAAAAEFIGEL
ncbi:MAG: indole-3-glycerol phosphate synthase TrpC [Marinirhabdus sp.]|nr:indole-3-glycerol phosphate synthase TrpC [Marinirhabdus sp.]